MASSDDAPALPLKSVAILTVLVLGVFGTGFVSNISDLLKQSVAPTEQQQKKALKKGDIGERGALTRLTRREINLKLAQVPVFFVTPQAGGGHAVFIDDAAGEGKIFASASDAEAYAKSKSSLNLKVAAATLEDIYYPLVAKKAKIGSFLADVTSESDPNARYVLVPPSKQAKEIAEYDVNDGSFPLFRVPNLAFQKDAIEIPLFIFKQDALSAWDRLQEGKTTIGTSENAPPTAPTVQVTSLARIVALWESGGTEGRALEIYPSIADVEQGRKLLGSD